MGKPTLLRKLAKLRRDPRAFARDSKSPLLQRLGNLGAGTPAELSPSKIEPRLLGRIRGKAGGLEVERFEKRIREESLSSAVLTPAGEGYLVHRLNLFGALVAKREFIGWRDRYLFAIDCDLAAIDPTMPMSRLLYAAPDTRAWMNLTASIRNLIVVNPRNALPALLRATNHRLRLTVILDEPCLHYAEWLGEPDEIDALILVGDSERYEGCHARIVATADTTDDLPAALEHIVILNKDKDKDAFVPVFGEAEYLEDIDRLVASETDGVLRVDGGLATEGDDFHSLLVAALPRIRWLLLRESWWNRYSQLATGPDALLRVLELSLRDGCRYELRT